jgi:UDP-glucose:(heptosyl)LPS alpha-1,3-glucosyltransferase
LRIGLITDEFNPEGGGAERWTAQFAEHLLEAGHEVHVITFRAANRHGLLQMHVLPDPRSLYRRALAVEAAVGGLGPLVLHDAGTGWSGHVFHPQTGSRLLSMQQEIHSHSHLRQLRAAVSPRLNLRRLRMAQIEARAATQARRVIAVSQRLRSMLVTRHHLDQQVVTVIPNGVDAARFAPERLARLRAPERARLGVGDELLCLMVAHNLRLKGFDTTLQALERLRRDGIEPRLAVVGGVPDRLWSDLVHRMGLADHVTVHGPVAEVERFYAAADVLVHPTRWDACSLATIEAMVAGLPVITTAVNGAADLITDGTTGYVLEDPEDHRTLAARIAALHDPTLRVTLGRAARLVSANVDIRANCRAVEAVLAEVAGDDTAIFGGGRSGQARG